MSEQKWKPGDVVRLKTGGWPMTVTGSAAIDGVWDLDNNQVLAKGQLVCVWFEKKQTGIALAQGSAHPHAWTWDGPKYGTFHEDALEICEPLA